MWRAGKAAGMIAIGEIVEAPTPASEINFPNLLGQQFWTSDEVDQNDIKVGIKIHEVRLSDVDVSRESFKSNPIVKSHRIITTPTGTVFQVDEDVANAMYSAWADPIDSDISHEDHSSKMKMDSEGKYCFVLHKKRERSSALRKAKINDFLKTHAFIHCELCNSNLNDIYPAYLADGYIEVHHIKPISSLHEHTPTHLDDLILLCPNCHRMVHRNKDAENNLEELKKWFDGR